MTVAWVCTADGTAATAGVAQSFHQRLLLLLLFVRDWLGKHQLLCM
jgi:hypothetical protein